MATDKSTDQALKSLLTDQEPPVTSVMRDLGIDHQAARRRRIPVLRQRFQKAKQRKMRLRTLKVRLRLHKGGIQPVALWCLEAQGLAPRYRTTLRQAMATQLGHHAGGLLDPHTICTVTNTLLQLIKSWCITSEPCISYITHMASGSTPAS